MSITHRIIATNIVLHKMEVTANWVWLLQWRKRQYWTYVSEMCLYQTFLDFAGNNTERKMRDSAKCKIYTKSCIVWNRNRYQNWHSLFWFSDTSRKAIYIQMQTRQVLANSLLPTRAEIQNRWIQCKDQRWTAHLYLELALL